MIPQGTNDESPRMTFGIGRPLLAATVAAWLVCAFAALLITGAARMTAPAHALQTAVACVTASGMVIVPGMLLCRLILRKIWSTGMCLTLAAMAALMCIGVIINVHGWCPDGNLDSPVLHGYSTDSGREWMAAEAMRDGITLPYGVNKGYPLTLRALALIFGGGILAPAMFSAFCMLLTAGVSALLSVKLLPSLNPRKTALATVALFALVPSIIWYGTLAMKEAPVCLGFALCCYSMACVWRSKPDIPAIFSGALGAFIIMVLKSPLGWLLLAGAVIMFLRILICKSRRKHLAGYNGILLIALLGGATVAGGRDFRALSDSAFLMPGEQANVVQISMSSYDTVKPYTSLIGNYNAAPLSYRLTRLPLAAAAQYFPPFPWNFTRDTHIGRFVPWAHLPFWYIIGGGILAYYVLCLGRRNRSGSLGLWSIWVFISWLGIAYSSGGSVARYWLPLLPAMLPLGLQAATCVKRGIVSTRTAASYSIIYLVTLAGALTAAYHFLHS